LCGAKAVWYRRHAITKSLIGYNPDNILDKPIFSGKSEDKYLQNYLGAEADTLISLIYSRVEKSAQRSLGSYFNRSLNRLVLFELAATFGLTIPNYRIITNEGRVDFQPSNQLVTKAMSDGIYTNIGNKRYYTYTERLEREDILIDTPEIFPSLVMEEIKKAFEVRAFYLSGKFYSMAIFSQNNEQTIVDFRKYSSSKPNRTEPFILPKKVENQLGRLYKALNLSTGSADLIVDKDGNYVFLEINPGGQFGMVSEPCNYRLEEKIAKFLAYD